ncbi:MobF family relaxase [Kocuria sp.]|uniref:MobF family relaxase n=1 Tax=Kocuria sp. TaxID=1871328 RepID=UPI0028A9FC0C|nr:MobF family relaxase [Kocuria sp.]
MTVSISRMSIKYYLSTVTGLDELGSPNKHFTSYYTASGDPAGTWFGAGLTALGVQEGTTVTQDGALALYEEGRNPVTGKQLGRKPIKTADAPTGAMTPSGKSTTKKREAVGGFDLTFSVPKSVSALWAVADSGTQARVHEAHQRAVQTCLQWAEENVIQARAGDGGVVRVPTRGVIASLFDHFDSRAGDPQLHTHAVLANRVQRASDGRWVTLDSYALHRWTVAISAMYNATLYDELGARVGAVAEQRDPLGASASEDETRNRRVEIAGVPDELILEFSTRSAAIAERADALIAEREADLGRPLTSTEILELRQQATLDTRQGKPAEKASLAKRLHEWRNRVEALNLDPAAIVAAATGNDPETVTGEQLTDAAVEEIAGHVLEQVASKHPTFTEANISAAAHRIMATVRFDSQPERSAVVERITTAALGSSMALTPQRYSLDHLTQSGLSLRGHSVFDARSEWKYTTAAFFEREQVLMDAATSTGHTHLEDAEDVEAHLEAYVGGNGHRLADDQRAAALAVATESSEISAIIGPAGTGKTTTLSGLRSVWESQQGAGSVIGLAPSAQAAHVLGQELGIPTDNVAKWLYESVGDGAARRAERYRELSDQIADLEIQFQSDPKSRALKARLDAARTRITRCIADQSKYTMRPGQLLLVDEASMASTHDLSQLHAQAHEAGAKVVLVGDSYQLDSIDAGGFLGWMEREQHAHTLTSVWRFQDKEWEPAASLALREGEVDVLDVYEEHERITPTADALGDAFTQWYGDTQEGKTSLLIAGRNDQVQALNERAQQARMENGEVDPELRTPLRHGYGHLGDVIVARQNNRTLVDSRGEFIKNGSRLQLTAIDAHTGAVTAAREDDPEATVILPRDYLRDSGELGYAATAHRAQGMTVDTSHVVVDETFSREQLYVAMTRGKASNVLYINNEERDPAEEAADPWTMLRPIVAENYHEVLAGILNKSDMDLTAHETQDHEHGWANDLGRASTELEYVTDLAATRKVHAWAEPRGLVPEEGYDATEMKRLVRLVRQSDLDPAQFPDTLTTLEDAVAYAKAQPSPPIRFLIPPTENTTEDEAQAQRQVMARIDARSQQIIHDNAEEPWLQQAQLEHPGALREILQWRAISQQTEAPTALGLPPDPGEHRLTDLWNRLQAILAHEGQRQTQDMPRPEPERDLLQELDITFDTPPPPADWDDAEPEPTPEQPRRPETTTGPDR